MDMLVCVSVSSVRPKCWSVQGRRYIMCVFGAALLPASLMAPELFIYQAAGR